MLKWSSLRIREGNERSNLIPRHLEELKWHNSNHQIENANWLENEQELTSAEIPVKEEKQLGKKSKELMEKENIIQEYNVKCQSGKKMLKESLRNNCFKLCSGNAYISVTPGKRRDDQERSREKIQRPRPKENSIQAHCSFTSQCNMELHSRFF